jgi:hypothetical protein
MPRRRRSPSTLDRSPYPPWPPPGPPLMGVYWWLDWWNSNPAYTDLSLAERGAFRSLTEQLWVRGGYIPNDPDVIADAVRKPSEWARLDRAKVLALFVRTPHGLTEPFTLKTYWESVLRAKAQADYRARAKGKRANQVDNARDNEGANAESNRVANETHNHWGNTRVNILHSRDLDLDYKGGAKPSSSVAHQAQIMPDDDDGTPRPTTDPSEAGEYARRTLELYRSLPGVAPSKRRLARDEHLALDLHARGVPWAAVRAGLWLVVNQRETRAAQRGAAIESPIGSLAYFVEEIDRCSRAPQGTDVATWERDRDEYTAYLEATYRRRAGNGGGPEHEVSDASEAQLRSTVEGDPAVSVVRTPPAPHADPIPGGDHGGLPGDLPLPEPVEDGGVVQGEAQVQVVVGRRDAGSMGGTGGDPGEPPSIRAGDTRSWVEAPPARAEEPEAPALTPAEADAEVEAIFGPPSMAPTSNATLLGPDEGLDQLKELLRTDEIRREIAKFLQHFPGMTVEALAALWWPWCEAGVLTRTEAEVAFEEVKVWLGKTPAERRLAEAFDEAPAKAG